MSRTVKRRAVTVAVAAALAGCGSSGPPGPSPAGYVASWENGRRRTAHQARTAPHEAGRDDRRA